MFVTALGRLAGIDPDSYKTGKSTDVKADAYYAPYVNWAAEKGIVNGAAATRAEVATVLRRFAEIVIDPQTAQR